MLRCMVHLLLLAGARAEAIEVQEAGQTGSADVEAPVPMKNGSKMPSLKHSLTTPVVKVEGEDAMLTCVVRNQGKYTLTWRRDRVAASNRTSSSRILTANMLRVTSDRRLRVMHEDGGEVYVLLITNVTSSDAGLYTCEVNYRPVLRSFHELKVLSAGLRPPSGPPPPPLTTPAPRLNSPGEVTTRDSLEVWGYSTASPIEHDFSLCCSAANVSLSCQGFCNLKSIMDGSTGVDPTDCEDDFPAIVNCMADGRDHLPCCLESGVPPACTDLCRGQYTLQTDNIKTLFSCAAYTAPTLACIADGIQTLPRMPQDFSATVVNSSSLRVSWMPEGKERGSLTARYQVNVTYLTFLSPIFSVGVDHQAHTFYPPHTSLYEVARGLGELVVADLETFSIYEVSMWAENNEGGRSQKTYSERVVTHLEGHSSATSLGGAPSLPDIRSCCVKNNVTHADCVDKFCDARNVATAGLSDLMICAPWDTEMFHCLADGRDHTPCCARKQIPPLCQELCTGNVTNINFQYFRCLSYMPELSSCMLEGYGVLPSSPVNFRFSNLHTDFGILHWEPPVTLGESVVSYIVNYRKISPIMGKTEQKLNAQSPFILEGLESAHTYEVYVEAANIHGVGEATSRIVFRTASRAISDLLESSHPYNQTDCCLRSGIREECMDLCTYDASLTQVTSLSSLCQDDFSSLLRCAAGGRDHLPCCVRRGVPSQCQPLCQAVHQAATGADFLSCLPNIGQVVLCFEEGTAALPPPVRDFRAVSVTDGQVVLDWKYDDVNGTFNTTHFEVYYKLLPLNASSSPVFGSDKQLNTSVPVIKISGLEVARKHSFFVVSRNLAGTSLPSSIITLNTSALAWTGEHQNGVVRGASSPPHLLAVESHSATWLQFTWNPPAISHPESVLKYRLFYRQVSSDSPDFAMVETDVTTVKLSGLAPNTQYSLYTTALSSIQPSSSSLGCQFLGGDDCLTEKTVSPEANTVVESVSSETLIAWTDPAFPAFVEAPTIHPINMVTEGSTMTVLCIAMGTPLPTVTLYINGFPLRSEVTRHMVTMVHNVTTDMGHVSCYADNGYGTPMQASRRITISRAPTIKAPMMTTVLKGDTLILKCEVDAFPAPTMAFFRDIELKRSMKNGGGVMISAVSDEESLATWHLSLTITNINISDQSSYYCHANNTLGEAVQQLKVNVTSIPPPVLDVTACCAAHNVTEECRDICGLAVDLDLLARRPNCLAQFHLVMQCASDGSDHRHCCSHGGVPTACLDWCRGEPVQSEQLCALSYSQTIVGCFHQGVTTLPSPPRGVTVRPLDRSRAVVLWDAPSKNPGSVELYRVFWRPLGEKGTNKTDTVARRIVLEDLQPGTTYELVVKAGNSNGTSQLTPPLKFVTADKYIIATSPVQSNAGGAVGIVLAVLLVLSMVAAVLYVMKRKNLLLLNVKKPESPTVAFENPFYNTARDQGAGVPESSVDPEYNVHISSSGSWHSELASSHSGSSSNSPQPSTGHNSPGQDRAELQVIEQVGQESSGSPGLLNMLGQARNGFTRFT